MNVSHFLPLDGDPVGNNTDDARPVHELGHQEGEVGRAEDHQRLADPYVLGKMSKLY